ncbi:MAG: DUF2905 domain-containing protein [Candidatus Poribacteria bacterium]
MMIGIGKAFIFLGILFVIIGIIFMLSGKITWLGKLPGDIYIKRDNFTFYFPITTCIIISIILTALAMLFRLFKR